MGQLAFLPIPRIESDVVYTPNDVAWDIVEFFKPSGKCLDPCLGDGAFFRYLPPGSDWCEITRGRDFFDYTEQVDWIIGNPPYSIFYEWLRHSLCIANNIVYLFPLAKLFQSFELLRDVHVWGGMPAIYVFGTGRMMGFTFGFAIGAVHFKRGYHGTTKMTFRSNGNGPHVF